MSMLLNQPYSTTTLVNYGKLEHRFPCSHACFLRTIFFPRAQVMRPQGCSDAQLFGAPFSLVARLSSPARRVESSNRFVRPGSVRPVRSPVPSTQAVRLEFLGLPGYIFVLHYQEIMIPVCPNRHWRSAEPWAGSRFPDPFCPGSVGLSWRLSWSPEQAARCWAQKYSQRFASHLAPRHPVP